MILDAHQHFWQLSRGDYRWLAPDLEPLYRDFLPADLRPLLGTAGVGQTILVQAADSVEETRFMLTLAGAEDFIAGVVGWVPMDQEEAPALLRELASDPALRGIRPMLQDIEDPCWVLDASLQPAFAAIAELGLCFDALIQPRHLDAMLELCRRYPELPMIIDHGAKPDIAGGAGRTAWRDGMTALRAVKPDLYCKVSGLLTEAAPGAGLDALRPYLDVLYEIFGPEHLVWGSDWPVLLCNGSYQAWLDMCRDWLADKPSAARDGILSGNARVFYGVTA